MNRRRICLGVVALSALAVPAHADAKIVGTTGDVRQIAQPADARRDTIESNSFVRVWDERQGVQLAQALRVNATPTTGNSTIPAGTIVSSQLVHADAVGSHAPLMTGTVTFDAPILGVIRYGHMQLESDFLGAPTIFSSTGRQVENSDAFKIKGSTLTVGFRPWNQLDELRVITAASPAGTTETTETTATTGGAGKSTGSAKTGPIAGSVSDGSACLKRHTVKIRLKPAKAAKRVHVLRVKVRIDGKRVKHVRHLAKVSLSLKSGRHTVSVRAKLSNGRTYLKSRHITVCG